MGMVEIILQESKSNDQWIKKGEMYGGAQKRNMMGPLITTI